MLDNETGQNAESIMITSTEKNEFSQAIIGRDAFEKDLLMAMNSKNEDEPEDEEKDDEEEMKHENDFI